MCIQTPGQRWRFLDYYKKLDLFLQKVEMLCQSVLEDGLPVS